MLLGKFLTNKKNDRYWFVFTFACRSWFLFLFVLFLPCLVEIFLNLSFRYEQLLAMGIAFILILFIDSLSVYIKWLHEERSEYKEIVENFGVRKYK